jgi:glycosyltransferase involved in cell wall biosynthesis
MKMPFISVAIPTCRRLPLLKRAIDSVFAQTFSDWELVVSDDEAPPGETWEFLEALACCDSRVRVTQNSGQRGATSNHNSALKASKGRWIKLLHDDDVLKRNCLEVLASIVNQHAGVVAVSCACEKYVDGRLAGPFRRRDRALLEQLEPGDALMAMYILDEACWALPSQQLVHRSVIEAGVLFEEAPGLKTMYDSWFNARLHAFGNVLVYNRPLVEWHQGQHDTTTSAEAEEQLSEEFVALRKLILSLTARTADVPDIRSAERMIMLIRSVMHLRGLELRAAMRGMASGCDIIAYRLAIRWMLRQFRPRLFSSIRRTVIWKDETE